MATVTVYTADRMKAIEDNAFVDVNIVNGRLVFTKHNDVLIDAGLMHVLTSPDGSKFKLVVANDGTLSTTPVS